MNPQMRRIKRQAQQKSNLLFQIINQSSNSNSIITVEELKKSIQNNPEYNLIFSDPKQLNDLLEQLKEENKIFLSKEGERMTIFII